MLRAHPTACEAQLDHKAPKAQQAQRAHLLWLETRALQALQALLLVPQASVALRGLPVHLARQA